MGGEPTVFEILRNDPDPAADVALLSALDGADLATAGAIVETLLTRNTREGLHGLVQAFHHLDDTLKQMVLVEWERLFSVLRECSQARSDRVRLNMLEMIRRACIYRAAYLVEGALRQRAMQVRQAAANTLAFLAEELLRAAPVPVRGSDLQALTPAELRDCMLDLESHAEDRRQLVAALESAVASYDIHGQAQVVEVSLWFLDDMSPACWSLLTTPGSRVAQVAARCITPTMSPRLVPFAMAALNFSEFRPHVAKAMATGPDSLFLEEWLRQSWRLAQPKIARGMSGLKELACAANHGWDLLQMPPRAQRHLSRWIHSVGLPQPERIDLLREALRHGCREASRSALWVLTTLSDRYVDEILWSVEDPEDPEIAQIARRELARRCPMELPISELIAPRADWDALQQSDRVRPAMTFERYWAAFDHLSEEQRVQAGHDAFKSTPLAQSVLARKMGESNPLERVRALRIISTLGLAQRFEERLYQMCHDPVPQVRSAAMAAVAPLGTPVARRLLRNALADSDPRVQANAVEAFAACGQESAIESLLDKLGSPDNRVQANAVKALLKLGAREAAEALLHMLRHENRMHRISALWLVDRMGLFSLASRVAGMAARDPDPAVRRKAANLAEHLPVPLETDPAQGMAAGAKREARV